MSSTKPSSSTLPIALSAITTITLFIVLIYQVPHLTTPSFTGTAQCVLYDRPPRTGSTTISSALGNCMRQKNYTIARLRGGARSTIITNMVSSQSNRLAAVTSHIAVSADDLSMLRNRCAKLLYITSSAPMNKRLYSAAKYQSSSGHGNATVEGTAEVIRKRANHAVWVEPFLEAYPYVTDEKQRLDIMPQRIVPDYVVRSQSVDRDLESLLRALRCRTEFQNKNVHAANFDEVEMLKSIDVKMGDWIYNWLSTVAKGNEQGLKKAATF